MNEELNKPVVPQRVADINAEIARQGNQGFSVAPSAPTYVAPTTITSDTLSGNDTPLNLPTPTPPSTTGVAITAKNLSSAEQAKASLDAEEQAYKDQAKETASTSQGKLMDLFNNQQKAFDEKIAGYQTDEFKALKELKTKAVNDQISLRKAQDAELKALETSGGAGPAIANAVNAINNKYAFQSAQLSLTSQIASNNFNDAKSSIDDLYTLTMEKYAPQINYYSQIAQNDQKIFTDAEVKILENKRDEYKTLQTQEADFVKTKGTVMITAKQNGADDATIQAMNRATDMASLVQAAGQYAGDVLGTTLKREQILTERAQRAKINADTAKVISESITTAPAAKQVTEATNTINDISNILSSEAFDSTFGLLNIAQRNVAGTNAYALSSQVNNLTNRLALAARGQLKGQGAVSDFEGKMLKEAQTALKLNMSPEQARKELAKVRGALATSSGLKALVKITNPNTKESALVEVSQEGITQAITDGNQVEYQ